MRKIDDFLNEQLQNRESRKEHENMMLEIMPDTAWLSNDNNFTSLECNGHNIRFRTSTRLERYTEIKEWDHGYLVVMAKYEGNDNPEEEYIDLIPILENLYINADEFLKGIKTVKIIEGGKNDVCKAIRDLMDDSREKGREEGAIQNLCNLVAKGLLSMEVALQESRLSKEEFLEEMKELGLEKPN